jgi:hypothetical protein
LQLAFESKSLRSVCESEVEAKLKLGGAAAETLKHRLADLQAATSVNDLAAGRPRVLDQSEGKEMAVELCDGYQLVFTPNHPSNPMTQDKSVDWKRVTRIKIVRIERKHG